MVGSKFVTAVVPFQNSVSKARLGAGVVMAAISLGLIALLGASQAHASLNPFVPERPGQASTNSLRGDFNGDAIPDEVYSVVEGEGRDARVGIHIRLSNGTGFDDQRLTSVDARESYSLSIATPRAFHSDCGTFSDDCSQAPITPEHDSLVLSMESGVELLVYFDKSKQFEQAFIASDEGLIRRTLRAFYAMQP